MILPGRTCRSASPYAVMGLDLGVLSRGPFLAALLAAAVAAGAAPAAAQRLSFERTVDVAPGATLDVTTVRGKVLVQVHEARQIRIEGAVTVRPSAGFTTAGDPMALAKRVAERPNIENAGNVVRLRPPSDPAELRALTVSYDVWVPRDVRVAIKSDSGAIDVSGVAGGLRVITESSAITLRGLGGDLDARTQSGAIRASFAGPGSASVETGSSAIQLEGLSGRLTVRTQSGRVELRGAPTAEWDVTTGSSVIEAAFPPSAKFTLEATSRSSDVHVNGVEVDGSSVKGRVAGTVGGGGPTVRLATRSGQVHVGH